MYVCLCLGVTDQDIQETIAQGACSAEEVMYCTGAGTRCGSCRQTVAAIVEEAQQASRPANRSLRVLTSAA
ncbi:MAG: (2Fe-2S)-binding protein [Minicystis sp.]